MSWIKRALSVVREHGMLILGFLALAFGASGAYLLMQRKRALDRANRRLVVSEAKERITSLKIEQAVAEHQLGVESKAVQELESKLIENKQLIARAYQQEGLTSEEIAEEFKRLGY